MAEPSSALLLVVGLVLGGIVSRAPDRRMRLSFTIIGLGAAAWLVLLLWPGHAPFLVVVAAVVLTFALLYAGLATYVERKVAALIQQRLGPYLVGPRAALHLILTGRSFSAREAQQMGLVTRVVEDSEVDKEVNALLSELGSLSPLIRRRVRQLILFGEMAGLVEKAVISAPPDVSADALEGMCRLATLAEAVRI